MHKRLPAANQFGFTLIELMVVIAIIAILSVIGITVFSSVQKSARNSKRISDMKAIALALEQYYYDPANNGTYPNITGSTNWRSECNQYGGLSADSVIPGLVPKYMAAFPTDPGMNKAGNTSCYLYLSNGTDYILLDHDIGEFQSSRQDYFSYKEFVDPTRDSGGDGCQVDGTSPWSWKISSPGGRCW